ncbi:hypothetical protein ACGFIX_30515 [Nocardia salmonicida]|uniref:hypothetical protein n=1 Tax=Nocardia salmonicida TaxID=53431 RepID=UPI00372390FC
MDHGVVRSLRGRPRAVRYDAIQLLERKHFRPHRRAGVDAVTLTLICSDGERLALNPGYDGQRVWVPAIEAGVVANKLPSALAVIGAGGRAEFGELWVTATEVGNRAKRVPIAEITRIFVAFGDAVFAEVGRRRVVLSKVRKTPDFVVFHALVDHLRGEPI